MSEGSHYSTPGLPAEKSLCLFCRPSGGSSALDVVALHELKMAYGVLSASSVAASAAS